MLSRVASSIYWLSRYVERAENVARFIEVNLTMSLDLGPEMARHWAPLIYTTGDQEAFYKKFALADQESVIEFLTFDKDNPNSILSCLVAARENARTVRDMISSPMWEELNKFYLLVKSAKQNQIIDSPFDFFTQIKLASHTLAGVTESSLSHGEAWHFHRLAQMLERADKTSRILDVKYYVLLPQVSDVGTQLDTNQWAALLKSASALEMYRKAYGRITPHWVAEFLVLDREFPRAIRFCLTNAEASLLAITGGKHGTFQNRAEQQLGRLKNEFDYTNMDEIMQNGLHEFIDRFQKQINGIGDAIFETFFALRPVPSSGSARPTPSQSQSQSSSTSSPFRTS